MADGIPVKISAFKDYDGKKLERLSDDELSIGSECIEWYRSAYQSKQNRGLFEKWNVVDEYWEGQANEQQYVDDPASNTNIIHPMIETQVALIADENWEVTPEAQTPSEIEYIPAVKRMLDFVFENNNMFLKNELTARRLLKYGVGIYKVMYDTKWGNGFGLPTVYSCNPMYVYPDPNVTDIYSIQEGRFIIETIPKSISWAKRKFGEDKAECIVPGYDPIYESTFYGENDYSSSEIERMHYLHIQLWEKYIEDGNVKLRLIQMSGDGTLLDVQDNEFCSTDFPYFFAPCYYREGTVWAKGDAELLFDAQEQINDFDDQLLSNARLTGNPQKVVDPALAPEAETMWTNEPGQIVPAINGRQGVDYLMPPSMPPYIIERRNRIFDIDVPTISRVSHQMMGQRSKGVDTATEALALQQSGMSGIDHKKKILSVILSNLTEYVYKMCLFYWDEDKYFTLTESDVFTGKKQNFVSFNPASLKNIPVKKESTFEFAKNFKTKFPDKEVPQYQLDQNKNGKAKTKDAQIRFHFNIGAGLPKNKAFLYTAMKELQAMGNVDIPTANKFFRDQLGLPIPVQSQVTPEIPKTPGEIQQDTMNMAGTPGSLTNQQGKRADLKGAPSQTPNAMVQGLNSKDVVKTAGGM